MSDAELESACIESDAGLIPWAYWTSELYSLGKCFRAFANYPRFLPLFVYSDHGAGFHSDLYPHELSNNARVFLTFHPLKAERNRGSKLKKVIHVPHPWIHYRRSRGIERAKSACGTLVFLAHRAPGFEWENHNSSQYFEMLRSLPDKFQPVVLCLHMHDVHSGFHKELRQLGFPIVTAGNTSSVQFVDRFYALAKEFSYATSQRWGSQVAYCVELGVPYFFAGDRPRLVNLYHKDMPLGEVRYQDRQHKDYVDRAETLFRAPLDEVTPEQHQFVEALLGLGSSVTRTHMAWIFWREFLSHWREWWPKWLKPILDSLRAHGFVSTLRKVRYRLRGYRR